MAEVKKPDFVLEVEQLVHRMLCKFNEHCKFAADSNFVETLNAIRQGKREYEEFFKKNDHILHQRIVQFLKSLKAVFNLLEMRYLIRANIKSCATVDLQQMRAWLYTAFQSREVVSLFRSVTEKLSVDFAINNFFRIAKIFATVTAACWQLKEDEAFLRSVGVVYHIDGDDFQSSCLNAEIQYMDAMFRQSIARMQDKDSESIEHMEKDKALDGFLQELKLPDVYKSFPHILRNFQDALSLARVMLPKLQEFELIMAKPERINNKPITIKLTDLFVRYWFGSVYHGLANFQTHPQLRIALIQKSMAYWDDSKDKFFKVADGKNYYKNNHNKNPMMVFGLLLERNAWNYNRWIQHCEADLMSTEMTEKAMAEAVKKINGLRRNATIYMTEFLRVLALDPANGVKERVQLYFLIAMNFRLIILKNNESREQNWSRAIPYMKKFVHAMKSDFAAYQEFGCKGTRENWIGNKTDVDSDEVLIEKLIQQYEKNAFYCKFNNYWNVVPINTRSA